MINRIAGIFILLLTVAALVVGAAVAHGTDVLSFETRDAGFASHGQVAMPPPSPLPAGCEKLLSSMRSNGETPYLGIGVLIKAADGSYYLGLSSYIGSQHEYIFNRLASLYHPRELLWMGELEFFLDNNNHLKVARANETSRFYLYIQRHAPPNLRVGNNPNSIPDGLRASDFVALPFDPDYHRLAPELAKVFREPRHDMANFIQTLYSSTAKVARTNVSSEKRRQAFKWYKKKYPLHGNEIRWLLDYLAVEKLKPWASSNYSELKKFLDIMLKPKSTFTQLLRIDGDKLTSDIEDLRQHIVPRSGEKDLFIFRVDEASGEATLNDFFGSSVPLPDA